MRCVFSIAVLLIAIMPLGAFAESVSGKKKCRVLHQSVVGVKDGGVIDVDKFDGMINVGDWLILNYELKDKLMNLSLEDELRKQTIHNSIFAVTDIYQKSDKLINFSDERSPYRHLGKHPLPTSEMSFGLDYIRSQNINSEFVIHKYATTMWNGLVVTTMANVPYVHTLAIRCTNLINEVPTIFNKLINFK